MGREREWASLTSGHSIGLQPRTSGFDAHLALATKDANFGFRQQVTIGSRKANSCDES